MKIILPLVVISAVLGMAMAEVSAQSTDTKVGSQPVLKNWTAPAYKMKSQAVVDEVVAKHPELLSLTLQGVPTGFRGQVTSTMFAGTFPDRIGKMSSDVDVLVVEKGYTILDPRWNQNDNPPKFTALMPLRDAKGQNIGLAVVVFKKPEGSSKTEADYFNAANAIRDELAARIPSHAALFEPTK